MCLICLPTHVTTGSSNERFGFVVFHFRVKAIVALATIVMVLLTSLGVESRKGLAQSLCQHSDPPVPSPATASATTT